MAGVWAEAGAASSTPNPVATRAASGAAMSFIVLIPRWLTRSPPATVGPPYVTRQRGRQTAVQTGGRRGGVRSSRPGTPLRSDAVAAVDVQLLPGHEPGAVGRQEAHG